MPRKEMPDAVEAQREAVEALRACMDAELAEIDKYGKRMLTNGFLPDAARFVEAWARIEIMRRWIKAFEPELQLRERHAQDAAYREQERVAKVERERKADADRARRNAAHAWLLGKLSDGPVPAHEVERDAQAEGHDILAAAREMCEEVQGAFLFGSTDKRAHTLFYKLVRAPVAA